jgi:hypothetical protein
MPAVLPDEDVTVEWVSAGTFVLLRFTLLAGLFGDVARRATGMALMLPGVVAGLCIVPPGARWSRALVRRET